MRIWNWHLYSTQLLNTHYFTRHILNINDEMYICTILCSLIYWQCWSQWLRGLRRRSAAAPLLRSWVRIPPGAWMFVCCECCVLSGRGICDELITRPEVSYRLGCVVVCDLETSRMRRPWPALGRSATAKNIYIYILYIYTDSVLTLSLSLSLSLSIYIYIYIYILTVYKEREIWIPLDNVIKDM